MTETCSCGAGLAGVTDDEGFAHGTTSCWRNAPILQPAAFVELYDVEPDVLGPRVTEIRTNTVSMTVPRGMLIGLGMLLPTPEERHQLDLEHEAFLAEQARQRALPAPALTLDAVLAELGWSPAYAAHAIHPACSCDWTRDDPYLCGWAQELGFTTIGGPL